MALQLAPMPTSSRWPLRRTELECFGQLFGDPELTGLVRAVITEVGPAWRAQFERQAAPLPKIMNILVRAPSSGAGNSGLARTLEEDAVIELSFSPAISGARLRHLVLHELAHVFINQLAGDRLPGRGLVGEYGAERMAWQIAREAGLYPGRDVSVEVYRKTHRAWLRPLVMIAAQMAAGPSRFDLGQNYTRNLRWLHAGAAQIANAEAYRLGQIDGGIKLRHPSRHFEPAIPTALEAALARLFAPLEAAWSADADGPAIRQVLHQVGPKLVSRGANIGSASLLALVEANRVDFLRHARRNANEPGTGKHRARPADLEDGVGSDQELLKHLRGQLVLAHLAPGASIVDGLKRARTLGLGAQA